MAAEQGAEKVRYDEMVRTGVTMKQVIALALMLAGGAPMLSSAQSLAVIAKQEEARRKAVTQPSKVYTNEDLRGDQGTAPPAVNASPSAPEPSSQVPSVNLPAGKVEEPGEVKDEAYWRGRINAARSALERSKIFAEALQSRINALTTDFVNRDDPAQRAQIELQRQRALGELDRVQKDVAEQTQAIVAIEEEARRAGVPPGWLR